MLAGMSLSWHDREWLAGEIEIIHTRLDLVARLIRTTQHLETEIMTDLTALQASVNETTTVEQSAITLIDGLADQIRALSTDPAALAALADQLSTQSAALAADVAANTPGVAAPAAIEPPVSPA